MSTLFETFPLDSEISPPTAPCYSSESEPYAWQRKMEKRDKKIRRLKKKQKKLLKRIAALKEKQIADAEQAPKNPSKGKWCETIRKVIPGIISIISSIVAGIFSRKSRWETNACR